MHDHYVPLIIYSQKNAKNKGNRKYKLSSHSTSKLKSKMPCGQSSLKAFLNKSLPENKVSWIWILLKATLLWEVPVLVQF